MGSVSQTDWLFNLFSIRVYNETIMSYRSYRHIIGAGAKSSAVTTNYDYLPMTNHKNMAARGGNYI